VKKQKPKGQRTLHNGTSWHNRSEDYKKNAIHFMRTASLSSLKSSQTNTDFAKNNGKFKAACQEAGVEPTSRQASKYRRGYGKARQAK